MHRELEEIVSVLTTWGTVRRGRWSQPKATKTVVVAVETFVPHYLYKKRIRKTTRFAAHDEG